MDGMEGIVHSLYVPMGCIKYLEREGIKVYWLTILESGQNAGNQRPCVAH